VLLSPSEELTWEKYTALVLLQQAYHARRSTRREENLERRCRGVFFRQPVIRFPKFPRVFARAGRSYQPDIIPARDPLAMDGDCSLALPGTVRLAICAVPRRTCLR
jgi:hypothetical protein